MIHFLGVLHDTKPYALFGTKAVFSLYLLEMAFDTIYQENSLTPMEEELGGRLARELGCFLVLGSLPISTTD